MRQQDAPALAVVATYPDLEKAREAMLALERAGIGAARISLLGRQAEAARQATQDDTTPVDTGAVGDVSKGAVVGGATGTAAGGVAGFLAGAAAFTIPGIGPVIGTGIWAATAGGATLGGGIGAFLGGLSSIPLNKDWELTYQDSLRQGRALVGVQADDAAECDQVIQILQGTDPMAIDDCDVAGWHSVRR